METSFLNVNINEITYMHKDESPVQFFVSYVLVLSLISKIFWCSANIVLWKNMASQAVLVDVPYWLSMIPDSSPAYRGYSLHLIAVYSMNSRLLNLINLFNFNSRVNVLITF